MAEPSWLGELKAVSPVLESGDEPRLTVALADLAHSFAAHAHALTPERRRRVLDILEGVLTAGSDRDRDAVATGFLEALLAAADRGFDLRSVWADMGPASRAYCLEWNRFTGVPSPDWMTLHRS